MATKSPPRRSAMSKVARPAAEAREAWGAVGEIGSALLIVSGLVKEIRIPAEVESPGSRRTPGPLSSVARHRLVELRAGLGDIRLQHRPQRLGIGQHHAIGQELGAGRAAEGGLVGPALVEKGDLDAALDGVELALADVPADGEGLALPAEAH